MKLTLSRKKILNCCSTLNSAKKPKQTKAKDVLKPNKGSKIVMLILPRRPKPENKCASLNNRPVAENHKGKDRDFFHVHDFLTPSSAI